MWCAISKVKVQAEDACHRQAERSVHGKMTDVLQRQFQSWLTHPTCQATYGQQQQHATCTTCHQTALQITGNNIIALLLR